MEQRATIKRMERVNLRRLPADWTADDEALLQAVDDATATPIEITRRLAEEWFTGVEWALDELEELATHRPPVALVLTEHLLLRLEDALASVDDSDGGMVTALERLLPLHRSLARDQADERLDALGTLELLS
jgi:hypothetical protein